MGAEALRIGALGTGRLLAIGLMLVLLAGCGKTTSPASGTKSSKTASSAAVSVSHSASATTSSSTSATAPAVTVRAESTKLGTVLMNGSGFTLYRYSADSKNESVCTGSCAAVWPVFSPGPSGTVKAGSGVSQSALGVITRPGGQKQVTYDGWPLYTYTGDTRPGQTNGQKVIGPAGIWYVVYAAVGQNPAPVS